MNESLAKPPPTPPTRQESSAGAQPGWLNALRGIWLFTWKSQMTWRRLPLALLSLLALPALVYLTTPSPESRAHRHAILGNPARPVTEFSERMMRARLPLTSEQQGELLRIFSEEFARTESEPSGTQTAEARVARQKQRVRACYDRIEERARPVLDKSQFTYFEPFANREALRAQAPLREPLWGPTEPFYHWLIDFYFFVILPLQCVKASGGLIRDELQADTLGFLLTRPVSRARLVILKYVTQTAWVQLLMLLETLLLFAAGGLRQIPSIAALLPLFLATQFLAVCAWSALGVLLGLVSSRYMALAMVYGLVVEMGIGRIPTNINTLSLMRHLKSLLSHNQALQQVYDWTAFSIPVALAALVAAVPVFLTLAALLFTFREYHHTAEMQK